MRGLVSAIGVVFATAAAGAAIASVFRGAGWPLATVLAVAFAFAAGSCALAARGRAR